MKNQYNKLIKRIITEASLDDDYSYNKIEKLISTHIKQMRVEIQNASQSLSTIRSMASRIQKGILDKDSLKDIKKIWNHINKNIANLLNIRNDLYADLAKNYDINSLPDYIIKTIVGSLYRSASSALSITQNAYKRCQYEPVENVFNDVEDCKHFFVMMNRYLNKITQDSLY